MSVYDYAKTDTTPEKAGYHEKRLQVLSDHYKALVDNGRIQAASFLMARGGKIFAHQVIGKLTQLENSPAIKTDSIKRVASISKLFTATAIMKLIEDGKLWLKQSVSEIIADFDTPYHNPITLWHLLTHTSGLPADPGYFCEPSPIGWSEVFDKEDWIGAILQGPLQNKPGENWNYCSRGYAILGEIVSRVSGQHFNDYVQKEIFIPLKMNRSFFEVPESLENEVCTRTDEERKDIDVSRERISGRAPRSGGGAYCSLYDLYRFGQCFLNGGTLDNIRILGRMTVEAMTTNQLENVPAFHWGTNCKSYRHGLGWGFFCDGSTVSPECVNHEGFGWSSLYADPRENFIFASFVADNNVWDPDVQVIPRTIAFSGIT
ncbi:beta-lactamase [Chitinispirillum alkaliphilum]|nr:beta-lactamase [Chitinispirillum alkaliphilum]